METDPKGQLGGMDCSAAERERVAKNSSAWTCSICGKSNQAILKETEEASKKDGSSSEEVEVPKELNMAWKDEVKPTATQQEASEEEATLAEGFVRTGGDGASDTPAVETAANVTTPRIPARPAQGVPLPTGSVTPRPAIVQAQAVVPRSNDGVPIWIDRAIAAIVILLVAMVLKILVGL